MRGGDMREANAMSTTAAGWRRAGGRFLVDGLLDAASPKAAEDGAGVVFTRNVIGDVRVDGVDLGSHRTGHTSDARMLRL